MNKPRPGTALAALYDPAALGAVLDGQVTGWGELAQAARAVKARQDSETATRLLKLQNAMSERVPSSGAFVVPETLRSDMVLASLEQAIMRPRATVIPTSTLRSGIPMVDDTTHASAAVLGGLTWNWTEEGATITPTTPAYGRLIHESKKLAAYLTGVSNELLDDAAAFEAFAATAIPAGLAWSEDQAFIAGSGTGQPQGVLNAPCAISYTRTTDLQDDIAGMVARMLPQSMKSFIWLCSPDKLKSLLKLFLTTGTAPSGAFLTPSEWLQGSPDDGWTLLGRPMFFTEHVPASGTRGDLILADPRFYVIRDRKQMTFEADETGAGFAADETNFRMVSRLDGRMWLQSPVTPQNGSATVSPVVILT